MNNNKTKSISSSKMVVGESFVASITDIKDGKYGPVYVLNKDNETVDLLPSGNLKFLADDLEKGKKTLNTAYVITRVADKTGVLKAGPNAGKTYTASQFTVYPAATATANQTTVTGAPSVSDKLAAIRAKRATNTQNG